MLQALGQSFKITKLEHFLYSALLLVYIILNMKLIPKPGKFYIDFGIIISFIIMGILRFNHPTWLNITA